MIAEKLRQLRRAHGLNQEQMAGIMGITRRSYGLYEKGERTPTAARLSLVAEQLPVSVDWLISNSDEGVSVSSQLMEVNQLAECGIKGWFTTNGVSQLKVGKPSDLNDNDAFAVMATGTSLVPEGIKSGYVCICSPKVKPLDGDVVYIKEKSGRAGLKVFKGTDEQWLNVEGYLPPDDEGEQMLYTERRKQELIEVLATVVYVKRRM